MSPSFARSMNKAAWLLVAVVATLLIFKFTGRIHFG